MADNIETISYINPGDGQNHPIDAVTVNGKTIPDSSYLLPSVTQSDNGKVYVISQSLMIQTNSIIIINSGSHLQMEVFRPSR